MPVSLGRRIRRIGIPPKEQRSENWKADLSNPHVAQTAKDLIVDAKNNRVIRLDTQQKPKREHRRSRNRVKHATKSVEVSRGKK